mgnify:CR=1 FL=1
MISTVRNGRLFDLGQYARQLLLGADQGMYMLDRAHLRVLHGSSFRGDAAALLRELGGALEREDH